MSIRGLLFSMLALSSMGACGASYYIDNDGGDNGNDGLSLERAWKTLGQAVCPRGEARRSFLFKRGCMWRGKTLDLNPRARESSCIWELRRGCVADHPAISCL